MGRIAFALAALALPLAAGAIAAQTIGTAGEFRDAERLARPVEMPPPAPANLRFFPRQTTIAESQIVLTWDQPASAEGFRVYRKREPLVALASGPELPDLPPRPFGWQEIVPPDGILLSHGPSGHSWADRSIDPPDPAAPLGQRLTFGPFCYKVEAYNEAGASQSDEICKRVRDVNRPDNARLLSAAPRSLVVAWEDTSRIEWGYEIAYSPVANPDAETRTILNTENIERFVIGELEPDTEYCVRVRAVSYYRKSATDSVQNEEGYCSATTLPDPEAEPTEETTTVWLTREPIVSGPIPYTGAFPALGNPLDGTLTEIRSPDWNPSLQFVKVGHSTTECGMPDAVVLLEPGGDLGPDELDGIYGTGTPSLPVSFLACAGPGPLLDQIPINISYTVAE